MKTSFFGNILISTFLWVIFVLLVDGLERVLLVSIFFLIPILLSLTPTIKRDENSSSYHAFLLKSHLYLAVTIGTALLFSKGSIISGLLSILWAVFTLALFVYGVRRFLERGWYIIEENAIDTSFLYAHLGGITLSLYCFTSDKMISHHLFMAAIHFHFTAIVSTVFIGFVGRLLPLDQKIGHVYRWVVRGTMLSPLIIGIGILTGPWIQNVGLWIYTICISIYSYFVFLHVEKKNTITSICIQLSTIVMSITTVLSTIQGIFQLQGHTWINSEQWI
ncbi:YndJ family transporter [Shimazuella kribbensis]|uniref:YndJ family transporter n=1 Tax=Shimazuella kribbensis TaxID=139808 RepID=UPI0003F8D237|nr:YndJ family transporter [Shimazuella kribbensis]